MLQEEKRVRIGPLFADDKRIAQGLLQAVSITVISRNPHIDTEMTLVVPDINQAAINLIENELFGKSNFQQTQMFSKGIQAKMNLPKIFAISSLDVGSKPSAGKRGSNSLIKLVLSSYCMLYALCTHSYVLKLQLEIFLIQLTCMSYH